MPNMSEHMGEIDKSELKQLKGCQRLWETHRNILQKRAIDLNKISAEWAWRESQKLARPGARGDFEELCKQGCAPHVLAAVLFLFRFGPRVEDFWEHIVGNKSRRERTTRVLEGAIETLEEAFSFMISAEDEDARELLRSIGRIPVSELISGLRFYVNLLNFAKLFTAETQTRSLADVTKYLLAGYVKRATGRFRDKNVSGLLAEINGVSDFNEVAQRMWRSRNYQRMETHFGKVADFLYLMGLAITRSA